jgi:hypothetical protein
LVGLPAAAAATERELERVREVGLEGFSVRSEMVLRILLRSRFAAVVVVVYASVLELE